MHLAEQCSALQLLLAATVRLVSAWKWFGFRHAITMENSKRIWLIGGLVALVVIAVGGWLGRPAYRKFKERRTFAQAQEALRNDDRRAAVIGLRKTLQINSQNLEAMRLLADVLTEERSPIALGWRRRAVELAPTLDHKVLLAHSGLQLENPPFPITSQVLSELRGSGAETNAAYHFVASQWALRLSLSTEAERHLTALIKLDPTNHLHQLNLATLRMQSKDKAVVEAARRELVEKSSHPKFGALALRSLVTDALAERRYAEADKLSLQLLALPQAGFEDRMQRLTVLNESKSADLPQWIEEVKRAAGTNVLCIAVTANWLNERGMATNAIAWLDSLPAEIKTRPLLSHIQADSYIAERNWTGLEKYLANQRWDELEFVRLAFLSKACREQNQRELANAQWRLALTAVGPRVEGMVCLAQMADRWGWKNETEDALWAAVRRAPWLRWAWEALAGIRIAAGDTAGLLRVRSEELKSVPESISAKNDVAIISMLLKRDLERANRLALEVYQAQPTNGIFVSTYAYSLHTQGKTADAVKLMQMLPTPALQRPDIATYHAVLLAANGQRSEAAPYFAAAEKAKLLPEERRLVEQAQAH
jgi:hypothetical protein